MKDVDEIGFKSSRKKKLNNLIKQTQNPVVLTQEDEETKKY